MKLGNSRTAEAQSLHESPFRGPTAFMMGNERGGGQGDFAGGAPHVQILLLMVQLCKFCCICWNLRRSHPRPNRSLRQLLFGMLRCWVLVTSRRPSVESCGYCLYSVLRILSLTLTSTCSGTACRRCSFSLPEPCGWLFVGLHRQSPKPSFATWIS